MAKVETNIIESVKFTLNFPTDKNTRFVNTNLKKVKNKCEMIYDTKSWVKVNLAASETIETQVFFPIGNDRVIVVNCSMKIKIGDKNDEIFKAVAQFGKTTYRQVASEVKQILEKSIVQILRQFYNDRNEDINTIKQRIRQKFIYSILQLGLTKQDFLIDIHERVPAFVNR
jgi:hypothetical protein